MKWGLLLGVAGALIVAAAAVIVVILATPPAVPTASVLPEVEPDPTPSATSSPVREVPTVADLPQLPIEAVVVTVDDGGNLNAVQRFADDVAGGATDSLLSKCWTFAPETILDRYASDAARGAILDALGREGLSAQLGAVWQGDLVSVVFPWGELRSTYACPFVTINGVDEQLSAVDAAYLVHRIAGRATGAPVDALDTEDDYPLICGEGPAGWMFAPDGVTPPVVLDPASVQAAAIALDGHPVEVAMLARDARTADYYEITSPSVPGTTLVARSAGVLVCAGEAR